MNVTPVMPAVDTQPFWYADVPPGPAAHAAPEEVQVTVTGDVDSTVLGKSRATTVDDVGVAEPKVQTLRQRSSALTVGDPLSVPDGAAP